MKNTAIVGDMVLLRPPSRRDGDELIALNRGSMNFHRGLAMPPIRRQTFDALLERCHKRGNVCFLVCSVTSGAIAGSINLSQVFRGGFQNAYLGYYIGAAYAGRGYMTEALQLLLRHAFGDLKLHRLEANIQPGNAASIALVKRAGFVREGYSRRYLKIAGRWRDHERWAIIAEDWRLRRKGVDARRDS